MEARAEYKAEENKYGKSAFNMTKHHLQNYRPYLATIERREQRLKELTESLDGLKATDYSDDKVMNSPMDTMLERMMFERMRIEDELRRARALLEDIKRAMLELDDEELQMVTLKWIEKNSYGRSWKQIAGEVNYSEETCKRRGYSGVRKIAAVLFVE